MLRASLSIIGICLAGLIWAQSPSRNLYEIQEAAKEHFDANTSRRGPYKHYKRAEYYFETRTGRNGEIYNIDLKKWKANERYKLRQSLLPNYDQLRSNSGDWDFVGPVYHSDVIGIMGRVNRITFHPTDPDIIYAATAGGGLWYTTNHGIFWYPLTDGIPVNNLSGVAVDPTDTDVIYILTGDGDGCCGGARGYSLRKPSIGVLKSIDGGQIWAPTGLVIDETANVWPYDLKMHPQNPDTLFVSTEKGLFRTYDGAQTWDTIFTGLINEIEFRTNNPSTIFAVDDDNFYKSTDLGDTWSDTVPIPDFDGDVGRMAITTCQTNSNAIYLIASPGGEDTSQHRGLFYSNNAGDSFAQVSDTPNVVQFQPNFDLCITCNPNDASDILIGAVSMWKSTDGGDDFTQITSTHADVHEVITNPLNDRLYAATDGGLYYSDDFGDSWTFMSEWLNNTQYYKIAVSQQDDDIVIGGAQDNGTHRNENIDAVFDRLYGKDGMDCAIHPLNDDLMIYSAQDGEFMMSTNGGDSEDSLLWFTSLPSNVESAWVTPIAWDPNNADRIFLGYKPIYFTTNGGDSFSPINDTISGLRILHVGTSNGDRLYAGDRYQVNDSTRSFHLWTSQDGGDEWSPLHINPGFPDTALILSSLTTNPDNSAEVWITVGGWDEDQKVYSSNNAGATWQNKTGTLPNVPVNCIVFQDTDNAPAGAVYIGTDLGVFYRDDNLGDWVPFGNGLPLVEVADLEIRYANGTLVAGTHGRGIWETDLYSACPNSYSLISIDQFTGLSYHFQAASYITSEVVIDGFGSRVTYRAGDYVLLEDGFRAFSQNGAFFKASLGDCDDGGVEGLEEGGPSGVLRADVGELPGRESGVGNP